MTPSIRQPLRPTLVMMSYRGGQRLARCLRSIAEAEQHFERIILSVTGSVDSDDLRQCEEFKERHVPRAEVICTGEELPTMAHQAFWVSYLQDSGASTSDWIYWLAYDDEVRPAGIAAIVDFEGNWPLQGGTAYFGPWAMRHESADTPYNGPMDEPLESWTSFPARGPLRQRVTRWIGAQFIQPTYMQMSGSVCSFDSFLALRDQRPRKTGPMRIEMAVAAAPPNEFVEEFPEPVSIIYGRPNSDRANYGAAARREDVHLALWLLKRSIHHPGEVARLARMFWQIIGSYAMFLLHRQLPKEEWRVRSLVQP